MTNTMIPRESTQFLTGLRGYSALGVFMTHAGGGCARSRLGSTSWSTSANTA